MDNNQEMPDEGVQADNDVVARVNNDAAAAEDPNPGALPARALLERARLRRRDARNRRQADEDQRRLLEVHPIALEHANRLPFLHREHRPGQRAGRNMADVMMRAMLQNPNRDRPEPNEQGPFHRVSYVKRAIDDQKETRACNFCKEKIVHPEFLDHSDFCATENGATDVQRRIPYHDFLCSNYTLLQELYKLRQELEISYLQAYSDRTMLVEMDCFGCMTPEAHMAGNCFGNFMQSTFLKKAGLIIAKVLAHHEQCLELKKQDELDKISSVHGVHFDSIEEFLVSDPVDLEAEHHRQSVWYEYRQNTVDKQTKERLKCAQEEMAKNIEVYNKTHRRLKNQIQAECEQMINYLRVNRERADLETIVQYRKTLKNEGLEAAEALERVLHLPGEDHDDVVNQRGQQERQENAAGINEERRRQIEQDIREHHAQAIAAANVAAANLGNLGNLGRRGRRAWQRMRRNARNNN